VATGPVEIGLRAPLAPCAWRERTLEIFPSPQD